MLRYKKIQKNSEISRYIVLPMCYMVATCFPCSKIIYTTDIQVRYIALHFFVLFAPIKPKIV